MISTYVEEKNCSNSKFLFPSEQEEQNTKLKEMFRKKREISYSSSLFQGAESKQLTLQEQTPLWMRTQPVMLIPLLHIVVSRREQVAVFLLVLRSEVELLERL